MSQTKITLGDIGIIKSRLARGFSYDKAREGTDVKSKNTVWRIAKEEKNDIAQKKKEFIAMVSKFEGDAETQAKQLGKQVTATYRKMLGKKIVVEEDWSSQLKTIQYLRQLEGLGPIDKGGTTVNILNQPEFIKQYDQRT